jgi:calcineurin-like phosphoesterase
VKKENSIRFFLSQAKVKFEPAEDNPGINGAIFTVTNTGKTISIKRIME